MAEESRRNPMRWLLGDGNKDYRYPGFYIGAATGVAFGIAALGFCGYDEPGNNCGPLTYVAVPLITGSLFGMFGALIGGVFDK